MVCLRETMLRWPRASALVGFLALALVMAWFRIAPSAHAQVAEESPLAARDLHVWGRFSPGSWKQVRIVTETLNERGEVTGTTITETKTTLVGVDSKSLSLKIEATVDVGGKRFESQSRVVEHGFFSEQPSDGAEMKLLGSTFVTVDGRQLPCQVRQVTSRNSGGGEQVTKLYLSESVEPFVLKRETSTVEKGVRAADHSTSTAEVFALDRYRVHRELKSVAWERTIQRSTKGSNVTLDVTCVEVPGGIVARATKELDEKGRVIRRSSLELVDYHAKIEEGSGDEESPRYLTRRQARKAARRGR